MAKHTSKEAYYERLRNLADVNKTSIKESKIRNLGSLIDYKRAPDGIAYGIVKENHNYFLKKAGTKPDPDVADFVYIGGMENITGYQYKSLAEADKQRNMMFMNIEGANSFTPNKTGSKMVLREGAEQEIDAATSKLGALDAATNAEDALNTDGEAEMSAGLENEPAGPDGTSDAPEEQGLEGGEPDLGGAEGLPAGGDNGEEGGEPDLDGVEGLGGDGAEGGEGDDEPNTLIKKTVGKLADKVKRTEMSDAQIKYDVNTFLASFADKFTNLDIEDRKDMANKILKVVKPEDIENLGDSLPPEEQTDAPEGMEEGQQCAECGGFAQYAESRGYNAQSIRECGEEEMTNLVGDYATHHNDGENDGDFKAVALFITPEILEKLRGDYGHDEYADKLTPYAEGMNETTEEDKVAQIDELFGGLKSLGNAAKSAVGGGLKAAGQAIGNKVQQGVDKVGQAASNVKQAVGNAATNIQQTYHQGEVNPEIQKVEKMANDLGAQLNALNQRLQKAGQQPLNTKSILNGIANQVSRGKTANIGATTAGKGIKREGFDPANTQVQPLKEDDEELEGGEEDQDSFVKSGDKPLTGFAPGAQSLGVATVKPDGAPTSGLDINISPDKSVNISMNESERKLRKYIRNRLEENAGKRKPSLNENQKSSTLKKLDAVIDKQFKLYENVVVKKNVNEGFGDWLQGKPSNVLPAIANLQPNDVQGIENLFAKRKTKYAPKEITAA